MTRFLAFGDSITEGLFPFLITPNPPGSYPAVLQSLLRARYTAQADSIVVLDEGLGGQRAADPDEFARFRDALNKDNAGAVLLMEGANDLNNGAAPLATRRRRFRPRQRVASDGPRSARPRVAGVRRDVAAAAPRRPQAQARQAPSCRPTIRSGRWSRRKARCSSMSTRRSAVCPIRGSDPTACIRAESGSRRSLRRSTTSCACDSKSSAHEPAFAPGDASAARAFLSRRWLSRLAGAGRAALRVSHGLSAEYFTNVDRSGVAALTAVDAVRVDGRAGPPVAGRSAGNLSARAGAVSARRARGLVPLSPRRRTMARGCTSTAGWSWTTAAYARRCHAVGANVPGARTALHPHRALSGGRTVGAGSELGARRRPADTDSCVDAVAASCGLRHGLGGARARVDPLGIAGGHRGARRRPDGAPCPSPVAVVRRPRTTIGGTRALCRAGGRPYVAARIRSCASVPQRQRRHALNTWIVAWVIHQAPRAPLQLFNANIFYPEPNTLAYSEALLVQSAMGAPLVWAGASPVLTYNILLIAGFALTGWAACLVLVRWTGDWWAGLAGASCSDSTRTR